jgi:hypothetical protein
MPRLPLSLGKRAKSLHAGLSRAKSARIGLKWMAARILFDFEAGSKQPFRTVHCGRSVHGAFVSIWRNADGQGARFSGVVTCGSGWLCPVCCMKIAEARRKELSAGLVCLVKDLKGRAHLLTFTAPHSDQVELAGFLVRFDKARARFRNSRTYKRVSEDISRIGTASSAEVTYGVNGWHPHLHDILFSRASLTDAQINDLKSEWCKQLLRAGLGERSKLNDMLAHALDVRGGEDAADYITKYGREETWGITSELTRQHTKEARGEHVTPFGLLALAVEGRAAPGGRDPRLLFREFAAATFGKRLLTFSPGLRKVLRLGLELTDQALVDEPLPDEQHIGKLDTDQWKVVLSRNAEAELLDYAARMCVDPDTGQHDLDEFVRWLEHRPPSSHGWFSDGMRRRYE